MSTDLIEASIAGLDLLVSQVPSISFGRPSFSTNSTNALDVTSLRQRLSARTAYSSKFVWVNAMPKGLLTLHGQGYDQGASCQNQSLGTSVHTAQMSPRLLDTHRSSFQQTCLTARSWYSCLYDYGILTNLAAIAADLPGELFVTDAPMRTICSCVTIITALRSDMHGPSMQ